MKPLLTLQLLERSSLQTRKAITITFEESGFLGADSFGDALTQAERDLLDEHQCTLTCHVLRDMTVWWIRCITQTYSCTINDQLLRVGESKVLHDGDILELSLLRIKVLSAEEVEHVSSPVTTAMSEKNTLACQIEETLKLATSPAFLLQKLCGGTPNPLSDASDLFEILPTFNSTQLHRNEHDTRHTLSIQSANEQRLTENNNVLHTLATEYVKVIRNPEALHEVSFWNTPVNSAGSDSGDILLKSDNMNGSLEDSLIGRMSIDEVLNSFGMDDERLLTTIYDDVLFLFAQGIPLKEHKQHLPELTRREHHVFSPDSYYPAAQQSK